MRGFHISREARELYGVDDQIFCQHGSVIFADFSAARRLTVAINRRRLASGGQTVLAGEVNAMGLIHEIMHHVIDLYRDQLGRDVMADADSWVESRVPRPERDRVLASFVRQFPPVAVHRGATTVDDYLSGRLGKYANRSMSLEELVLLRLENENPAYGILLELFDETELRESTAYAPLIQGLDVYFRTLPPMDTTELTLLEFLRAPMRASPFSIMGQLAYIRTHWYHLIADLLLRILKGMDYIREETRPRGFGKPLLEVPRFGVRDLEEIERFSADVDWMPRVVLMAKCTHVWLHQLSRAYGRSITRIDEIPDEELIRLARWGFTALWLIGIWERSPASRTIKQMTGNPEAIASAYSIRDYAIAGDLGGEEAYERLRDRAWRYGIRLSTDMVPNHMGVFSSWVIEHPERFIQLSHPPYHDYHFSGPNLSGDERVEVRIEDGYWSKTNAAVVFERLDRWTGEKRYIYHGNDGTHMPWNDTAQLDMLQEHVRRAVIDATIDVARKFPIIRFDAAMTLAKRHFQRLWYPAPGFGGDIPSRAEHTVSTEEFERLFPVEFWRELVDRVAVEAPDTLLLAEAFWLMEGYFVRSLGMHRVYNSAFMNMLKAEENSKYRDVIKNVLRFNPEILRRFVNFMNNPDEEPAVEQFGKDDKYFGVATLMVTMPGLPMFGHGQVEGFFEKYGMEYARDYWNESVDDHLVSRHEREIFPLLAKRHLFSGVDNFVFYDVVSDDGSVNEDVFAYSNRAGAERALIVYNNRYAHAHGTVRRSVGFLREEGGRRQMAHVSLAEGLGFRGDNDVFYVFRDMLRDREFLREGGAVCEQGLVVDLGAFHANVFLDFREVVDTDGCCRELAARLGGAGVPDVMTALQEIRLESILQPFRRLVAGLFAGDQPDIETPSADLTEFLAALSLRLTGREDGNELAAQITDELRAMEKIIRSLARGFDLPVQDLLFPVFGWVLVNRLDRLGTDDVRRLLDELLLGKVIAEESESRGQDGRRTLYWLSGLLTHGRLPAHESELVSELFADEELRPFLGCNEYEGRLWFSREAFRDFYVTLLGVSLVSDENTGLDGVEQAVRRGRRLLLSAEQVSYDEEEFCRVLNVRTGRPDKGNGPLL